MLNIRNQVPDGHFDSASLSPRISPSLRYFFWTHTPDMIPTLERHMKDALDPTIREVSIATEGLGLSKSEMKSFYENQTRLVNTKNPAVEESQLFTTQHFAMQENSSFDSQVIEMYRRIFSGKNITVTIRGIDITTDSPDFIATLAESQMIEEFDRKLLKDPASGLGNSADEVRASLLKIYRDTTTASLNSDQLRNEHMSQEIRKGLSALSSSHHMWVLVGNRHGAMSRLLGSSDDYIREYLVVPDKLLPHLPDYFKNLTTCDPNGMNQQRLVAGIPVRDQHIEDSFLTLAFTRCISSGARNQAQRFPGLQPLLLNATVQRFFAQQCVSSLSPKIRSDLSHRIFESVDYHDPASLTLQATRKIVGPFLVNTFIARKPETHNHAVQLLHDWFNRR